MIYICNDCRFLFSRAHLVKLCVDCGSENIREANKNEQQEFEKNEKMHDRE